MNLKSKLAAFLAMICTLGLLLAAAPAEVVRAQFEQPANHVYEEAMTVYLGNLARRENGVPPLRWNWQMTRAARWFSWDSVENRTEPYCGHQDTQGNWPDYRIRFFGYLGFGGAENAFCGYVTPQQAIDGWLDSPGHRANLLDSNSREIGLGYYVRESDGRGYVTQDFGVDAVYPPLIIENEAPNVTSPVVSLYVYDRSQGGGFAEMGPAAEMMLSNNACFSGASWQPYTPEPTWTLESGTGWRTVYARTRDTLGRTSTVSDTIYLGADLPLAELGQAQMSTTHSQVILYGLEGAGLPYMQFSLGWRADNTFGTFGGLWGNGELVNDAAAWGGSAFRMYPGDGESSAWVWTTEFTKDTPFVGYVRLKVSDNTSPNEVARISVTGGDTLSLKGTDFTAANQYQEFPLAFNFPAAETFLIFQFWRSGAADVYVDALTIFTAPQPVVSPLTWNIPGGNYRGQGIWLRYTNGAHNFSDILDANTTPTGLAVKPPALSFRAQRDGASPAAKAVTVQQLGCQSVAWQASTDVEWLTFQMDGDAVSVTVNPAGLAVGDYTGTLMISASGIEPLTVTVDLAVVDQPYATHLPIVVR